MGLLKVITYGHPVLRKKAEKINEIDDDLLRFIDDMYETMVEADGIGLAAPQVNRSIRLIVIGLDLIDEELEPMAFLNPEIIEKSEETEPMEEGCLSIPGIREEVIRPVKVKVKFNDVDGNEQIWDAEGLLAKVFQHEIDHLNGILFTDRISPVKKSLIADELKNLEKMYG